MDFYLILIPLGIPAIEQTRFFLVLRNLNVTNFHRYTNVLFSQQGISLENLCSSLYKGVLWFALLPLLWYILVLDVSCAKKTSPDTWVTFCPSQAKLSHTGGRKTKGFQPILWPFCYLHLEPAWNVMCYSFINAVTWAGVQLDKRSSGLKAPAQVWELLAVSHSHCAAQRNESFLSTNHPRKFTLQWGIPFFSKLRVTAPV